MDRRYSDRQAPHRVGPPRPGQGEGRGNALEAESGRDTGHRAVVPSDELFRGGDELWISHRGEVYRLRKTRLGRLLLTK